MMSSHRLNTGKINTLGIVRIGAARSMTFTVVTTDGLPPLTVIRFGWAISRRLPSTCTDQDSNRDMGSVAPTGTRETHTATVTRSASVRMVSKSGGPLTPQNATDGRRILTPRGVKQDASAVARQFTTQAEIGELNKAAAQSETQRHDMSQHRLRMLIDFPGQPNRYAA